MKKEQNLILTAEGYLELEERLNYLKLERRPQIIEAIKDARAQGDLSENADYDAARNAQAQIEAEIKELEYRLEHSQIAEKAAEGEVTVGCDVTVMDEDDEEDTYKIVGSAEADSFNNKISNESPLGKALMGHKEGETVTVSSPNGEYNLTILKVE